MAPFDELFFRGTVRPEAFSPATSDDDDDPYPPESPERERTPTVGRELAATLFLIGPSHLHPSFLKGAARTAAFGTMAIEAHCGLPVWSHRVPQALAEHAAAGRTPVWLVSDWKFNNFDYDALVAARSGGSSPFLDTLGHAGNVSRNHMQPQHIELLAQHGLDCIDEVLRRVPTTRLIFWCLYHRTKGTKGSGRTSSYPPWARYDAVAARYRGAAIDIDAFTDAADWHARMVADTCGHPKRAGYDLIARMLAKIGRPCGLDVNTR